MKPTGILLIGVCSVLLAVVPAATANDPGDNTVFIQSNGDLIGSHCHSHGFPVILCAPGNYKLVGTITVPANLDAIDITADNVTLDLNGFSIIGPVTCTATAGPTCSGSNTGSGIFSPWDNTVVKNGVVNGFVVGVYLIGRGSLVDAVHAKNNLHDGIHAEYGVVQRSTAIMNGYSGVYMTAGVIQGNFYQYNYTGIFGQQIVVIGNSTANNNYGLNVVQGSLYGSNSFTGDVTSDVYSLGAISQGNNVCGLVQC